MAHLVTAVAEYGRHCRHVFCSVLEHVDQEAFARIDGLQPAARSMFAHFKMDMVAIVAAGEPDELADLDPVTDVDGDPSQMVGSQVTVWP